MIAVILIAVFSNFGPQQPNILQYTYSEFLQSVKTGNIENGDYELTVSINISNAPLRYIQIGEKVSIGNTPYTNENLISGITLMPKTALWMSLIALPKGNLEKSEEGVAKLVFTLSGLVDDEIKTLIEMDISILYKTGKQLDDSRIIQASIKSVK